MVSGGGTGGHIYPAVSIAQSLKEMADVEILFVGAKGKMEMTKVPDAGFEIVGLWISGLQRSLSLQNLMFPFQSDFECSKGFWSDKKIQTRCGNRCGRLCQCTIAVCIYE